MKTSIIVRTCNRTNYLLQALKSIAFQDYPEVEAVIINDGGEPIQCLLDHWRLPLTYKLIENSIPRGRSFAANLGMKESTGHFIGFLDDDDILYPHHVSTLVDAIMRQKADAAYSISLKAIQAKCTLGSTGYMTKDFSLDHAQHFDYCELLTRNFLPICSVLFKSVLFKEEEGTLFDEELDVLEDWDFWIRLLEKKHISYVPTITAEYRVRTDTTNTQGQVEHWWIWARKYLNEKHQALRDSYKISQQIKLG